MARFAKYTFVVVCMDLRFATTIKKERLSKTAKIPMIGWTTESKNLSLHLRSIRDTIHRSKEMVLFSYTSFFYWVLVSTMSLVSYMMSFVVFMQYGNDNKWDSHMIKECCQGRVMLVKKRGTEKMSATDRMLLPQKHPPRHPL